GPRQLPESEDLPARSVELSPAAQPGALVLHPGVSARQEGRSEPDGKEPDGKQPDDSEPDELESDAPRGQELQLAIGRRSTRQAERPFSRMSATKEAVLPLET